MSRYLNRFHLPAFLLILFFIQILSFQSSVSADETKTVFKVLDISEHEFADGPAVAVLFSAPLDPKKRHDAHLSITDGKSALKNAWVLSDDNRTLFFPHVNPETRYIVAVETTLASLDGTPLENRVVKEVTIRKITPSVSFLSKGLVLPSEISKGLPLVTVNVNTVDVEIFRIKEKSLTSVVDWQYTTGLQNYYILKDIEKYADLVYSGRFDLNPPKNKRVVSYIPVTQLKGVDKPGVYLTVLRRPGEYDYSYKAAHFIVTDIGIHARVFYYESELVITSLKTGKPISGVDLTFYDNNANIVAKGTTGPDGLLKYNGNLLSNINLVTARDPVSKSMTVLSFRTPSLDLSGFDVGGPYAKAMALFMESPRDIYRPGESVLLTLLLRNHDGMPVESMPLNLKIFRPDSQKHKEITIYPEKLEDDGLNFYSTVIDLPKGAQTGIWWVEARTNPATDYANEFYQFHVEEFLPERMKLDLASDEKPLKSDTPFDIGIQGAYLYGAPASGNRLSTAVGISAVRSFKGEFSEYLFGLSADRTYKEYLNLEDIYLDQEGKGLVIIKDKWKGLKSPVTVRARMSLYESGGRPVVRSISRTAWPSDIILGIRPGFGNPDDGSSADPGNVVFDIIRINTDGKPVDAPSVMANLKKVDRNYFWEYSENDGWNYRYTEKIYDYLSGTVTLKDGIPGRYEMRLDTGRYILTMTDPEKQISSSVEFNVGNFSYDAGPSARPDAVTLQLDKTAYRAGDIARLKVIPPHAGEALILVEGGGVIFSKQMPITEKGETVDIPIDPTWNRHDIYASAVVFRPAGKEGAITPNRAVGIIHLPIDRSDRKLDITIDAPENSPSQGPLTVKINVKSEMPFSDAPVYITLAAVDTGILAITDFKTPDPFAYYFDKQAFPGSLYDMYGKVIENPSGTIAGIRYGGDMEAMMKAGNTLPDANIKLLSMFSGPVKPDANGDAVITLDMPDFNGAVRLMALGFGKDRFGSAEKEIVVKAPVITQISMPRFLSSGDDSGITLDVHNQSGSAKDLDIKLYAEFPLEIKTQAQPLTLSDNEKKTLVFPVKAVGIYGISKVKLTVNGAGISFDREWELPVRPGYPPVRHQVRSGIKPVEGKDIGETFELDKNLVKNMAKETIWAAMSVSSTIPLDIEANIHDLLGYPYGCLEQTLSSAYPLIYATPEIINAFNLKDLDEVDRIARFKTAVDRLSTMKLSTGGFGLWTRNDPEEPWLTVYAAEFLVLARDAGLEPPNDLLDNVFNRLTQYLTEGAPIFGETASPDVSPYDFAVRSYAAYVLSLVNQAPLGTLRPLYDNHKKAAPTSLSLVHLGLALKNAGDADRSISALDAALGIERKEYWEDYGGSLTDAALSLALGLENKIDGFDSISLMTKLDKELRERRWFSTQEQYALLRAGMAMKDLDQEEWLAKLTMNGQATDLKQAGAFVKSLTTDDIQNGISVTLLSPKPLFITAIVKGYENTAPTEDASQIYLKKTYYDTKGNEITGKDFNVGDLILVHVFARAKIDVSDALISVLFPAGFEPENPNLTDSFSPDELTIQNEPVWRLKESVSLAHEEYRDDRYAAFVSLEKDRPAHFFYMVRAVTPGVFNAPPVSAESMYHPEIRSISESYEAIRVKNKP